MASTKLFSEIEVGDVLLKNRIVMAPMTRSRAGEGNVPGDIVRTYYGQRASAGLIVTEATQISTEGVGYMNTPGIYSPEQVQGWKKVTQAVHDAGGKIFLQLWHVGRISHPLLQPEGRTPVSASAVEPAGEVYTPEGMKPFVTPRALTIEEIARVIGEFRKGAENAKEAGFDGVELHGANGYLVDQFLRDGTNKRTDAYGGSAIQRARFLVEAVQQLVEVWGAGRVGVRLSPSGTFNDMKDSNPVETFGTAIRELDKLNIAYVHIVEGTSADEKQGGVIVRTSRFRQLFRNALIVNGGYTREKADAVIDEDEADLVSFGVPFIANPDLPKRFAIDAPLAMADIKTFYGGGQQGYIDYPALETAVAEK